MFEMWKSIITVICLGGLSVEDIRRKEISGWSLLITAGIGLVLLAVDGCWREWQTLYRFVPGLVWLLLGWMTRESIGYGDGLVLLCMGGFMGISQLVRMWFAAITMAGLVAIFLLVVRHMQRKAELPFVPFLLMGYGMTFLN